jgi:hypothetical protein
MKDRLKDIPLSLYPIAEVLFNTFPWVDRTSLSEFQPVGNSFEFEIDPIPTPTKKFSIGVHRLWSAQRKEFVGCIGLSVLRESVIRFLLADETDAIGAVSAFMATLPEEFFEEPLAALIEPHSRQRPDRAFLTSPSRRMSLEFNKPPVLRNQWIPLPEWNAKIICAGKLGLIQANPKDLGLPETVGDLLKATNL